MYRLNKAVPLVAMLAAALPFSFWGEWNIYFSRITTMCVLDIWFPSEKVNYRVLVGRYVAILAPYKRKLFLNEQDKSNAMLKKCWEPRLRYIWRDLGPPLQIFPEFLYRHNPMHGWYQDFKWRCNEVTMSNDRWRAGPWCWRSIGARRGTRESRQLGEGKSKHSVCLIRDSEIFPHFLAFVFLQVDP